MTLYVLLMVVLGGSSHPTSLTAEFNNQQACTLAAAELSQKMNEHYAISERKVFWTCSPKG